MVPPIYHSVRCPHIITLTYVQYCHRMSRFNLDAPSIKRIRGTILGAPYYTPGPIHPKYPGISRTIPGSPYYTPGPIHPKCPGISRTIPGSPYYTPGPIHPGILSIPGYLGRSQGLPTTPQDPSIPGYLVSRDIRDDPRVSLLQTWPMLGLAYASRTSWDDPARVKIGTHFSSEVML